MTNPTLETAVAVLSEREECAKAVSELSAQVFDLESRLSALRASLGRYKQRAYFAACKADRTALKLKADVQTAFFSEAQKDLMREAIAAELRCQASRVRFCCHANRVNG